MISIIKKFRTLFILLGLPILLFISCQKDMSGDLPGDQGPMPDLSSKVSSSVSGFVTNENNQPVAGATVQAGGQTAITDEYGYFIFRNIQVVKNAAVVTVNKSGYFKGIKTYIATENKSAFFRIKLIPKNTAGTFSAASGGNVSLTNGLQISFPANAIVNKSTNSPYTGSVNVAAYWINPASRDLPLEMPGDLRAINQSGYLRQLTTYGMIAVEMTGSAGESLQIAPGSKATVTFPLPASHVASAPASIALWSFDEEKGLWKEEGSAVKTGNSYVGEVSHFSFWNCDVPNTYVQFSCTVVDSSNQPITQAFVKISVVSNPNNAGYGFTDTAGYVSGAVPDNAQLLLEIFADPQCSTPAYTQTFTTTNVNVSLGTIAINNTTFTANVTGTMTNCTGLPVNNGFIIMKQNQRYYRYSVNSTGGFDFNTLICSSPTSVEFIAEDITAAQQSNPIPYALASGTNNIGVIQACGNAIQEYFYLTVNGTNYAYTPPTDTIYQYPITGANYYKVYAVRRQNTGGTNYGFVWVKFDTTGIAQGTAQAMFNLTTSHTNDSLNIANPPVMVNITEWGAPTTGFMAGYFSGNFVGSGSTNYTISGSFRTRRRS